jgi:hypothetical protein
LWLAACNRRGGGNHCRYHRGPNILAIARQSMDSRALETLALRRNLNEDF